MWVEMFRSNSPSNYGQYKSPSLDTLLDEATASPDQERRNALIAQAEDELLREQVIIPIYHSVNPYLLRSHVGGFAPQAMEIHLWKYIYNQPLNEY